MQCVPQEINPKGFSKKAQAVLARMDPMVKHYRENVPSVDRIRTLETRHAALREVALEAAEYLENMVRERPIGNPARHANVIAAKLRAALEKDDG